MINKLINSYLEYLGTQFETEKLEKNIYKVITPFLDRRNDYIILYIILKDNIITLTDDGYTLEDLEFSGLKLTKKRMNEIYKILNGYGVHLENKKLFVNTTPENFAQKKHNFIQALLSINDMYFLTSEKITSIFLEEVQEYFDKKQISYIPNIILEGKSGINHKFDFIIPKNENLYSKEEILKTINSPNNMQNLRAMLFSFEDIRNSGRTDKGFVIINDKHLKNNQIFEALENYQITPILWSKKENELQKLKLKVA